MANNTKLSWLGNMSFDTELDGHHFTIDAHSSVGGNDEGPRPKGLLLSALGGCTGMDVVSILKKMKVENYKLVISVSGEQTEEHPKFFHSILVQYRFEGEDLPISKIKKAVELSESRYCGVSAMLRKAATLKNEIYLNGDLQ